MAEKITLDLFSSFFSSILDENLLHSPRFASRSSCVASRAHSPRTSFAQDTKQTAKLDAIRQCSHAFAGTASRRTAIGDRRDLAQEAASQVSRQGPAYANWLVRP